MRPDRRVRRLSIPRFDRIHDSFVLIQRSAAASLYRERRRRQKRHRPVDHVELLDKITIVAGKMDLPMEPLVRARQLLRPVHEFPVLARHLLQHPDLFRRGMLRRQSRSQALQFRANHIKLTQLVVIEARHDETPPVPRQHTLRLQALQRLPDRRARHPELLSKLQFDQPVSRTKVTLIDRLENEPERVFLTLLDLHRSASIRHCEARS